MFWVNLMVQFLTAYFAVGLIFAAFFVFSAVHRIDPLTRQASVAFRFLILPGSALLWPLLLQRCLRPSSHPPLERTAHRSLRQGPR